MDNLDPKSFYFELPLYTPIEIGESNKAQFLKLLNYDGKIDEYSLILKENTTYSIRPLTLMKSRGASRPNGKTFADVYFSSGELECSEIVCVRKNQVIYVAYFFDKVTKIFMKVGQYPSVAELHISKVKSYDKVLNKEKLKEFTRAIGLAANGVGIGSFVYLRRIFEDLIGEARVEAVKAGVDITKYFDMRMDEKIGLLEDYLPEFLVENKSLYGMLSKGMHVLTEEECLLNFETVKVGIELILDEKLEKFNKKKKIEDAKKKISAASSQMKKSIDN